MVAGWISQSSMRTVRMPLEPERYCVNTSSAMQSTGFSDLPAAASSARLPRTQASGIWGPYATLTKAIGPDKIVRWRHAHPGKWRR